MQNLKLSFLVISLLLSCSKNEEKSRILIVTSNQHTYGNTIINASNHFSEIVLAYDIFIRNGFIVDFVSPEGGPIPIGYIATSDPVQKTYLYNSDFMTLLKNTKKPSEISSRDYKAIYYSGGGAAMFGVPENSEIQEIALNIYKSNGIISTVCHGTAGISYLKDEKGKALYKGLSISAYPDAFETKDAPYYQTFPFSIQETISKNGGDFQYTTERNASFYVIDGPFITGQGPSSTVSVANSVAKAITSNNK